MNQPTRKIDRGSAPIAFLDRYAPSLVVLEGPAAGTEFALDRPIVVLGRAENADVALGDDAVSGMHACLELGERGFVLRDLASTNGTRVNGHDVVQKALTHGDRIQLGCHVLQYVVEEVTAEPRVWTLDGTA